MILEKYSKNTTEWIINILNHNSPVNLHFDLKLIATVAKMFSRVSFSTT